MTTFASPGEGGAVVASLVPFVDPLPMPPRRAIVEPSRLTIRLQAAEHQFHRALPPVASVDLRRAPTRSDDRGTTRSSGRGPVGEPSRGRVARDCRPGASFRGRRRARAVPSGSQWRVAGHRCSGAGGFPVAHLHGGLTHATSDGWTENLALPGQSTLDTYPNDQRAAMLWYHDHVMGVTRFSVYAGLAGLWIVRDERERELDLPEGPPYEVPLLLADRNFDVSPDGRLNGELLHKTDPEVMECFSPFTVVNGAIWPVVEVEPTTYRFRVLNGSNARTYRLVLTRDGAPDHRADHPDRHRRRTTRRARGLADTRARAGLSRTRRSAGRLLRSRAGLAS